MDGEVHEETPLLAEAGENAIPRRTSKDKKRFSLTGLSPRYCELSLKDPLTSPMLRRNYEVEKYEEVSAYLFDFEPPNEQRPCPVMIKYSDTRITGWGAVFHFRDTVFADNGLWATCSVYWALTLATSCFVYYIRVHDITRTRAAELISNENIAYINTIASYFTALIGFLIGMYVSNVISRWWSVRTDCVGKLWRCIDEICLIVSVHMPNPEDRTYKERILRLGLLSHRLCYMAARGETDDAAMQNLVRVGLLSEEEKRKLTIEANKSQIPWVWIGRLVHELGRAGKIEYPAITVPQMDDVCGRARGAICDIAAFADTQLPFQYVHMLAVTVIFNNIMIALKCGLVLGSVFDPKTPMEPVRVIAQIAHVSIVPFFYHSFMRLSIPLSDPLGYDFSAFPSNSFHCAIRDENCAYFRASENVPATVIGGVEAPPHTASWSTGIPVTAVRNTLSGGRPPNASESNSDLDDDEDAEHDASNV